MSKVQPGTEAIAAAPAGQTAHRPLAGADATRFGPGLFGDSSPSSARRYFSTLAALSPSGRGELVSELSRMVRASAWIGARRREPQFNDEALRLRVAELMYGRLEPRFNLALWTTRRRSDEAPLSPYGIALAVGEVLESLGIAHFVGGALASGLHGEPRATNDVDLVLELRDGEVDSLVQKLGPDFSVDEAGLREAVRTRRSDCIYILPLLTKVDLFICGPAPFDRSEMARRRRLEIEPGRHLWVESAEDTLLRKLLWFRQCGEVSETQWRDITSVLRVSGGSIDAGYLDGWAAKLGVDALLAKARVETGQG